MEKLTILKVPSGETQHVLKRDFFDWHLGVVMENASKEAPVTIAGKQQAI